jgi:large subunit ribosomal protein L31
MKKGIHPKYVACTVRCACGNEFETRATVPELRVDICNVCHPFYTGKQKFVDTAGRVQKFMERYGDYRKRQPQQDETAESSST